ncbi:MAG: hypothetical protein QXV85_09340 [Candidatus Bathyarchaeia archaeon]
MRAVRLHIVVIAPTSKNKTIFPRDSWLVCGWVSCSHKLKTIIEIKMDIFTMCFIGQRISSNFNGLVRKQTVTRFLSRS